MVAQAQQALVERTADIAELAGVLDRARRSEGRLVVIEGEPGIGKSALLRTMVVTAASGGMHVLEGRGGELERQFSNGVVLDLFSPMLRTETERARWLTGNAAAAGPIFSMTAGSSAPSDPHALLHGLYWLTVAFAEEAPLLIAVDDVPWVDDASLRFLAYLARRISDLPVAMMMTFRPPTDDEAAAVSGLRGDPAALHLRPERLSVHGVSSVLAAHGVRPDPAVVEAWWSATRGTPLYVQGVAQRREVALAGPSGRETAETLSRSIRQLLGSIDAPTRRVAEAVAILGNETSVARVARLTRLSQNAVLRSVRVLTDRAVFEAAATPTFVHPIVRSATIATIPPAAQAGLRRAAADVLSAEGATIEAGTHLLECPPAGDPAVVEILREGAAHARARGDGSVAVAFLARALDERAADRLTILPELADAEAMVGLPSGVEHWREVIDAEPDPVRRATFHLGLGHALIRIADWGAAMSAFADGRSLLGDDPAHGALTASLEAGYVSSAWISRTNLEESEEILDRYAAADDLTMEQRELLVSRGFIQASAALGTAEEHARRARSVIENVPIEELVRAGQTVELTTGVLFTTDALAAGEELLTRAIDAVPRTGMISKLGMYSYCRAWPRYVMGQLSEAAADAQAAMKAHEMGWETFFPVAGGLLAFIQLDRGEIEAAEAAVAAVEAQGWTHRSDHVIFVPLARGRMQLAGGDMRAAAASFLQAGEAAESVGMRTPGPAEWRSWAATALALSGERQRAREIAAEGLQIATSWAAAWPRSIALRGMGLAVGGSEGLEYLRQSVEWARSSPSRLEEARNLVELGAALRRSGGVVEARSVLAEGIEASHRIGAAGIGQRGRRELLAAGGRPRRIAVSGRDALTPAELRVVQLVQDGRTNRQVAESLFVTPKAVEYHLNNAYRKLGIGSRAELADALRDPVSNLVVSG